MNAPAFAAAQSQAAPPPSLPPPPSQTTQPTQIRNSAPCPSSLTKPNNLSLGQIHKHPDPVVGWTSSISRRCKSGDLSGAVRDFLQMRISGVEPNHVTFVSLLSGCAHFPSKTRSLGASLHGYVRKLGLDSENVKVGTALVDMYSKFGLVDLARRCFDRVGEKNSMTWNTMIDGYVKKGRVEDAVSLFDEMPERGTISWTALIGGFVKQGMYEQALELFCEMQLCGVEPDYVTVIGVISACANLGVLNLGLWINRYIMDKEFKANIRVLNSLIDMYCRCGNVEFAQEIFNRMPTHSVVSWNSIITGFASNGKAEEALRYFSMMQKDGCKPNGVTLTGALSACSHAGLLDEGLRFFENMQKIHRISPTVEHYGCLVDLYSRAGRLIEALNLVAKMPMRPNEVVLGSLLASCRNYRDVQIAEMLTNYLVELYPDCDSNYVLLANMYAATGSWEGSGKVRRKMKNRGIQKKPGVSLIDIDGCVHEFVACDKSHAEVDSIYAMLELILHQLKVYGYVCEYTATTP